MRVFVTGGAGFIGSNLVDRLLAEGHRVDAVDDLSSGSLANLAEARSTRDGRLTFHQLDIRSDGLPELMERCRPQVVFHLAARPRVRSSMADTVLDAEVDVVGSVRVLEGARTAGVKKVVFASSGAIYGDPAAKDVPVKESHPQRPVTPYGVGKKAVGDYLSAYRELYSLEFTALALANVYGPRQNPHRESGVAAIFAGHLLAGEPCTVFGDGTQTRDFVYVDDVVDAFARAAERGGGLVLNVGTGQETTVNELYRTMARQVGEDRPAVTAPARPGDTGRRALDPRRAAMHIGWEPWTSLAEGSGAVLEWLRATGKGLPDRA